MSAQAEGVFYSQWFYSAVRLLTANKKYSSPALIAKDLGLNEKLVKEVLEFLVRNGLCELREGLHSIGPVSTHLNPDNPLALRHHMNWRQRVLETYGAGKDPQFALTMPCLISLDSIKAIRKELSDSFEKITQIVDDSPAEHLVLIECDLLKLTH